MPVPIRSFDAKRLAALPESAFAVKLARLAASMTQQQVADELGCTVQYVCHIEAGRGYVSDRQVARILRAIAQAAAERNRG
jgi:transcriptional regulator with XRE-family HTH domain